MKSKHYQNFKSVIFLMIGIFISINFVSAQKLDWLEDQPPVNSVTRVEKNKLSAIQTYPRRSIGTLKNSSLSPDAMACFDIVCAKLFVAKKVESARAINPNLSFLREFSPQAWQGAADGPNLQGNGYPFNTTGPATANNQIFAGHWAYKAYTKLTNSIGIENNIVINVDNNANILDGESYCVIRPSDSWENAEHVKITKAGSIITITMRGYKSEARTWPSGSIIAQHQLGNGTGNLNWVYNHSTKAPKDKNGKRAHEAFSDWLSVNFDKDEFGKQSTIDVDGILYDADPFAFIDGGSFKSRNADLDNDGTPDWGYDELGNNHWGKGLELFYSNVRKGLDKRGLTNAVILGGVAESYGILSNNGTQMEAAWSHQFGENGVKAQNYNYKGFYISGMKAQTGHGVTGPRVTDVQGKEASAIYPGKSGETRNSPVRFSYAMTMMFDGAWFSNQNGFDDAFHYFDEDAVYTQQGENYGKSVLKANTAAILANNKWLGKALGQYKRIYDRANFTLDKNLITNGNFEASIGTSWKGEKASAKQVSDVKYEGKYSLLIEPEIPNKQFHLEGASVSGPSVELTANQEYTLCFSVYNENPERIIKVKLGSFSQKIFATPGWSKHVLNWKEKSGGNPEISFEIGGELTKILVDQLYLFAGTADIFRRDFENGIILANASATPQTIKLEKSYQRILGNLDTTANNGQTVTEVTIPAHDGLFLIKASGIGSKATK